MTGAHSLLTRCVPLCALLVASACGDPAAPVVDTLTFDGQAPDSPLVLLLSLTFRDATGDLGDGVLETIIDGQVTQNGAQPLLPLFLANDVELDAAEGLLHFVVELALDGPPASPTSFELGVRVTDGAEHTSAVKNTRLRIAAGSSG